MKASYIYSLESMGSRVIIICKKPHQYQQLRTKICHFCSNEGLHVCHWKKLPTIKGLKQMPWDVDIVNKYRDQVNPIWIYAATCTYM